MSQGIKGKKLFYLLLRIRFSDGKYFKTKRDVVQLKKDIKANIWYNALEQKITVFSAIYFPASSYPVFVFVQNNHGCLSVMQSLQYKILYKSCSTERYKKKQTKQ